MTEKLEKILLKIMECDHQKLAQEVLVAGMLSGEEDREAAYREVLEQVSQTGIQAWARAALAEVQELKEITQ